jgi:hypothetical protein
MSILPCVVGADKSMRGHDMRVAPLSALSLSAKTMLGHHLLSGKMSIKKEAVPITQLCTSCFAVSSQDLDTLLSKPGDNRNGYPWTTTRKHLHASSALGCPLCTIIFKHTLKGYYYKIPNSWTNTELIEKWEAGDEAMPFRFLYSQHWEAEIGSRVFKDIYISPDKDRGGEGSAIVSFKYSYFLFGAS